MRIAGKLKQNLLNASEFLTIFSSVNQQVLGQDSSDSCSYPLRRDISPSPIWGGMEFIITEAIYWLIVPL
jgi:hypothetical protein